MTHRGHCPVVLTAYTGGSSSCSALPLLVRTRRNEPFVLPEGTPLGTSGSDGRRSPCLRRARSPIYLSPRDPNSRSPFPDPRDHRSQITTPGPHVPRTRAAMAHLLASAPLRRILEEGGLLPNVVGSALWTKPAPAPTVVMAVRRPG